MRILFTALILGVAAIMTYCSLASAAPAYPVSSHYVDGKFRNGIKMREYSFGEMVSLWWNAMLNKPAGTMPKGAIPVHALSRAALLAAPDRTLFRLGHSTMLFKLGGEFYLTDPVFSERASPVQWAGPKRFHAPPIGIEELPPIKAVILSHDHYDHLDHAAIMALAAKTEHFLAPLGVGDRLVEWGVDESKVRQLDWWQEERIGGVRFVATPAQHFSGRTLGDRDSTLWASWVILHDELRLFFSGDSGYFKGFKTIGERFGPFDVAMVETGAYDKQWPDVHMQPEETLQAFLDLKGKWLLPVHNGTFDLALHRWQDPLERIAALAEAKGVALTTPEMGEPLSLAQPHAGQYWWRKVD
ncbi:Outer membrane protein romA [Massilia sp. 9I]|nr:Outer membrane protein romA [Massilia sp. 9I]